MPPSLRCALTTANIIYEPLRGHRHVQSLLARHGPLDTPARLYVARLWGRQLLLALAAAHKYGLRLRTLSARQVHRASTQPHLDS